LPKLLRLICCLALWPAACTRIDPPEAEGTLVVAIREAPAFFQERGDATTSGFEHDLVTAFADSLGPQGAVHQGRRPTN
jgi:ABC-type amino acid transport substrate-binding protein